MVTLEQQRQQLEAQKAELQPYKETISKTEEENQRARELINKSKANLSSARALRSGIDQNALNKRNLALNQLGATEKNVSEREQAVSQYKTEIASAESQIDTGIADIDAIQMAEKLFERGVPYGLIEDSRVKDYLKQMYNEKQDADYTISEINAGRIPEGIKSSLNRLAEKGITGEKAWSILGFRVTSRPGETARPSTQNDMEFSSIDVQPVELSGVNAQSKVLNNSIMNNSGGNFFLNNGTNVIRDTGVSGRNASSIFSRVISFIGGRGDFEANRQAALKQANLVEASPTLSGKGTMMLVPSDQAASVPGVPYKVSVSALPSPPEILRENEIRSYRPVNSISGPWQSTKFGKPLAQGIKDLSDSANYYLSFGGALDRQPDKRSPYDQNILLNPNSKGTAMYRSPNEGEMSPEQKYTFRINKLLLNQNLDETEFNKQQADIRSQYEKSVMKANIGYSFVKGAVVGGISVLAPPIGATILGLSLADTTARFPEVKKQFEKSPGLFTANLGAGIIGGIVGGGITSGIKDFGTGTIVEKITPTPEMLKAVEPFSRQRATALIKTPDGAYIFGKTKTGEIISFGGVANKGESLLKAASRELTEETGLRAIKLQEAGKVVTPEETFSLFTATLTAKQVKAIRPSSDVVSIVKIPAWRVKMMTSVTGQTQFQPVSRVSLFPLGKIRAYEYSMLRQVETGQPYTWLQVNTKQGPFILGTQSRYDVPFSTTKAYEKVQDEQLFAHGTPNPAVSERFFKDQMKVQAEASKRGTDAGLFVQPPTSPGSSGYIGLSYLGFGSGEGYSIKFTKQSPTALLFKEQIGKPIVPTQKAFIGMESERIILPETGIETSGSYQTARLGFRKVYFQPSKIKRSGEKASGELMSAEYVKPNTLELTPEKFSIVRNSNESESSSTASLKKSLFNIDSSKPQSGALDVSKSKPSVLYSKFKSLVSSFKSPKSSLPSSLGNVLSSVPPSSRSRARSGSPPKSSIFRPSQSPKKSIGPILSSSKSKSPSISKSIGAFLKVFKRRKGEDILVGSATTKGEASRMLKKALKSDLSASGFIETGKGNKLLVGDITDWDFRTSKVSPTILVQRSGSKKEGGSSRLSNISEINEIQLFNKKRKKKEEKISWF